MNALPPGAEPPLPILSDRTPPRGAAGPPRLLRRKRLLMGSIYLYGVLWGVRSGLAQEADGIDLLFALALGVVCTLFCVVDSQIRGRPIVSLSRWLMVSAWTLAVPAYLFWSGGRQTFLRAALSVLGFVALYVAGFIAVSLLLAYAEGP